jgi:dipeptide transport system ATP-binding protein
LFAPRCVYATARSRAVRPELRDWTGGRVRCHYPLGEAGRDARIAADGPAATRPQP